MQVPVWYYVDMDIREYLATLAITNGSSYFSNLSLWSTRWNGTHPFNVIADTFR